MIFSQFLRNFLLFLFGNCAGIDNRSVVAEADNYGKLAFSQSRLKAWGEISSWRSVTA